MRCLRHIAYVFIFLFVATASYSQTEGEIKENAEKLFENEEYVSATSLYLRLISLNPRDADYNFRYGTCLLFNSYKKQEAIRYLSYSVNEPTIDPRAYYFYGRALHLNYQFEDAKKYYRQYLEKRQKVDKRYDAEREIQMCDNGKRLLTTFTDIIVSEKKEIEKEKFFRLYNNLETIGGNILVSADFQSKLDKKKGHIPIVHFPPKAMAIYYSSYGETGENGLDIYIRRRLPDNTWGDPELLPGAVNTPEDEDFPYMHPSGEYLYFSSKGHNSMGGFDVFYSLYDPNSNSFGQPENVDFAISSPDDDLFYVVDSLHRSAYFASARQSQNGKLHVYQVRVARVPIQEVIIMGDYLSDINPENKEMTVHVKNHTNGDEIGMIKSNAKGNYSFVFPKGGKYDYEVSVAGSSDVYKFLVEVPFLDEFRPLKQKALHTMVNGEETVKIVNLFDERVEGAEAIMAEVIRKRAELDVNINKFDMSEIEAQAARNEVLAQMGFKDMSLQEVSAQLEELAIEEQLKIQTAQRIETNMNQDILERSETLNQLVAEKEQLEIQLSQATDPISQHTLLNQIKAKETEMSFITSEIKGLNELRDKALATVQRPSDSGIGKVEMLENQFNALLAAEKEEEALKLLAKNKDQIIKSRSESPDAVVENLVNQSLKINDEIKGLTNKVNELEAQKRVLEQEILTLDSKLAVAKKKDIDDLKAQIKAKQDEIALINEVVKTTNKKIDEKNKELSVLDNNIASLQKAMVEENTSTVSPIALKKALDSTNSIDNELDQSTTENQIAVLESNNPELNPDYIGSNNNSAVNDQAVEMISSQNDSKEAEILQNPSLSEQEKNLALIENNEKSINAIDKRLTELENSSTSEEQKRKEQERLEKLRAELEEKNKSIAQQNTIASNQYDQVVEDLTSNYAEQIGAIENNSQLTEEEVLENKLSTINSALNKLYEEKQRLDQVKENSANSDVQQEYKDIEALQSSWSEEKKAYELQLDSIRDAQQNNVALSIEDVQKEISSSYTVDVAQINSNSSLTEQEKLEKLQELDRAFIASASNEKAQMEEKIRQDPNDSEAEVRIEMINALVEEKQGNVVQREERIQELKAIASNNTNDVNTNENNTNENNTSENNTNENNTSNEVVSKDKLRKEVLASVNGVSAEERNAIAYSGDPAYNIAAEILELEAKYLEELKGLVSANERKLETDPTNEELKVRSEVLNDILREQQSVVDQQRSTAINEIGEEQVNEAIAKVDRRYSIEIGALEQSSKTSKYEDIADREVELQESVAKKIAEIEESQSRSFSVSADLELATYKKILQESKKREEQARTQTSNENIVTLDKESFVEELRSSIKEDGKDPLTDTYSTKEELEKQDRELANYQAELEEKLNTVDFRLETDPSNANDQAEKQWIDEELSRVTQKRRQISVSIGELETNVVANNTNEQRVEENKEVESLINRQEALEKELSDPNLDKETRKEIQSQLNEVKAERVEKENEWYSERIENEQKSTETLIDTYKLQASYDPVTESKQQHFDNESKAVEQLIKQAENAKSEEEKNHLYEQAREKQVALNDDINNAIVEEKRKAIEENENVTLVSKEELEQRKRSFTVEIGELNSEIIRVEKQIETAKKKDVEALNTQRTTLIDQRNALQLELAEIENRLASMSTRENVTSTQAQEQEITFNEERKIASSDEYKAYEEKASTALEIEQEIADLEKELKKERAEVNSLLANGANQYDSEIQMRVQRITKLQSEIDQRSIELVQRKYEADQVLPDNKEEAMKMQNLVFRGIKPIQTAVVATALINLPADGFAINETAPSVYSAENPIPLEVESPKGLVYRVQVGAFARPIPQDLFKEFNPVSGEKIQGTNITRYMAGYFNNSQNVIDAREQIRALGYSDAFVVAYCDGKRVQFGEARRMEESGTCVPKESSEMMMEIAENTAETMGIPLTNEVVEVPETSYNQAPGAADADPIELKQGLFFTVQIGVFNRPVGEEHTYGMPELLTIRLPNGQIRYASGMFDSVEEALPRRDKALISGVKGAFVTAYYKGERITLAEARKLLEKNGRSILQSEIERQEKEKEQEKPETPVVNPPIVKRTDTVATNNSSRPVEVKTVVEEQRIQIVTKKQFDEFPRDVLNRYNAEGSFFYDEKDQRVKSVIYKSVDDLPRLWNFRDDIDTVYLSLDGAETDSLTILEVDVTTIPVPGDFMDWLMRFNYRREFVREKEQLHLRIYGIEPNKVSEVQGNVRKFGLESTVVEENEVELELGEE